MKLTDRTIAALPAPARNQQLYTDDLLPGFAIRVSQGGSKTFVLTVGRERRRITIGRYPVLSLAQARNKAKTLLAQRQLGLDRPRSPRFSEIEEEFLASREAKLRAASYRKDVRRLAAFASLANIPLSAIEPEQVQAILDAIPAPSTRHEALNRFRLLVNFARKRRYVDRWPLDCLEVEIARIPRDRVLSDNELRAVLTTARMWRIAGHHFGTIVELLVYTGQRRQQIGSLERSYVDFDNETITWPAELMKAGRKHTIPLGKRVRAILEPRRPNGLYFPNKYGEAFSFAAAHDRAFRKDCGFDDWVLHDLRRTLATRWQEIGIEIATTEKMLSHSAITGGLVGIYQRHTYLAQMRLAVQDWEDYLQTLLSAAGGGNGRRDLRDVYTARACKAARRTRSYFYPAART